MTFVRWFSRSAWAALVLCLACHGLGADAELGQAGTYRLRQWTTDQGLSQNSIKCLLQTRDGYLWAGTMFGLMRFDGTSFKVLDQAELPEFQKGSDAINALAEDMDGALWIGTASGLVRGVDGRFTRFTTSDGLPHNTILSLAASKKGGVWIGTDSGFCLWRDGQVISDERWKPLKGYSISGLAEEGSGQLWITHSKGASQWQPEGPLIVTNQIAAKSSRPPLVFSDHLGQVWMAGQPKDHVYCISNNVVRKWRIPQDASEPVTISALLEDSTHVIHAFVSGAGLYALGPNGFELIPDGLNLGRMKVDCGLTDSEGNLWLGTHHDGLLRLQRKFIKTYTGPEHQDWNRFFSVCGDTNGVIWAGTASGVLKLQDGTLRSVPYKEHPDWHTTVGSVFVDRQQRVWAGPRGAGLFELRGDEFICVNPTGAVSFTPNISIEAMWQDPDDTLWFGSSDGLWSLSSGQWTRFTHKEGLPQLDIRCLLRDSSGKLWVGTHGGGLSCFYQGRFTNFSESEGLPHGQVHCLFEDSDRTLWVGTQLGLARFKNGRLQTISTRQGLYDNCINHIEEDDGGKLWISCNRAIYSVLRAELAGVAEGRLRQVNCVVYGEADGMLSNETNGEHQPSGWKGPDGRLWFPTEKGLAVVDPRSFRKQERQALAIIEQVRANGMTVFDLLPLNSVHPAISGIGSKQALPVQGKDGIWKFPADIRQSLEFHFVANSFTAPERTKYRYMLEGYDARWHDAGPQRLAIYHNLHAGDYKFRVLACNYHGVWSEQGSTFAFSIAPYFTETAYFYVCCAVGGLFLAYSVHHSRVRVVRKMQQLQSRAALSEQRARIARDMHDDLGANLSKIALINEVVRRNLGNPQVLQTETSKIANIASQTVDSLSELIWAANPKNDTVETLFSFLREYVGQFFEESSIHCQTLIASPIPNIQVDFQLRRQLFLVVKEALHNILKHSKASNVQVQISLLEHGIAVQISDDGIGLKPSTMRRGGNGLANMRQRVAECHGTFEIRCPEHGGTSVYFTIPLAK